jgi:thioredoxin 1
MEEVAAPTCPAASSEAAAVAIQESREAVTAAPKPAVTHIKTLEEFQKTISSGQPSIVKFFATWCGPCRYMAPIFEREALKNCSKITFAEVDVDWPGTRTLVDTYAPQGFPTFVFFNKSGEKIKDHPGAYPDDQFATEVAKFVEENS